jgi:hypothetical protein
VSRAHDASLSARLRAVGVSGSRARVGLGQARVFKGAPARVSSTVFADGQQARAHSRIYTGLAGRNHARMLSSL